MKTLMAILVLCLIGRQTHAWGGLFNRFSPEMLANMGYGGHGGFIQVSRAFFNLLNGKKRKQKQIGRIKKIYTLEENINLMMLIINEVHLYGLS